MAFPETRPNSKLTSLGFGSLISLTIAFGQTGHPIRKSLQNLKVRSDLYETPRLKSIDFHPIKLSEAITKGKAGQTIVLKESDTVQLRNGKSVKSRDLINATNALEKRLNAYGYTLRQDTSIPQSPKIVADIARGQSAFNDLGNSLRGSSPKVAINGSPYEKFFRRGYLAEASPRSVMKDDGQDSPEVVTSPKRWSNLQATYHAGNSYNASAGDFGITSSYSLDIKATADAPAKSLKASVSEMTASVTGDLGIEFFGNNSPLIHADASYVGSDKTGQVTLALNVGILGENVYQFGKSFDAGYSDGDQWAESFDWKATDLEVPLGPFTVDVQSGVEGSAGVIYNYKLSPSRVHGLVQPFCTSDAYFQLGYGVGNDLIGADVGVEGHMTLFDDTLTLGADAGFYLDEGHQGMFNIDQGLYFSMSFDIENQIHALDGSVDAYAEGHLGPFHHTWTHHLFNTSGISGKQVILNKTYNYPLTWH